MIYEISSIDDPRVALFATMTETQLRNRLNAEQGLFIAESPKVIRVALQAGYEPQALLCEQKHIEGDAADIIEAHPSMPVYTGSRELPVACSAPGVASRSLNSMKSLRMPVVSVSSTASATPPI